LDVYRTSTHDVALVQIYNVCLKCAARGSLKIQDAKITQKSPSAHHRTTRAYIGSQKKMLNSNISSTCPDNMVNFGPVTVEVGWRVWGTPTHFNGFYVLASFTAPTSLNGGQPNFARCLAVSWAGTLYMYISGALVS